MSGRLVYGVRNKYPHMTGEDKAVWDRFVVKFPNRFDSVDYDFRVGEGDQLQLELDETFQRMVTMLSQLRIDAIGWNGEQPTIVEVKPRAIVSALGQIQGYKVLFMREFKKIKAPDTLMVCEMISPDVKHVFDEMKIPVEVV